MPLIQGASKKARQKNIETEMEANPAPADRKQNLAIAYAVQKKNRRKKMAQGGLVEANTEKRPMPDQSKPNKRPGASKEMPSATREQMTTENDARDSLDETMLRGAATQHGQEISDDTSEPEGMTDINKARSDRNMNMMADGGQIKRKQELMDSFSSHELRAHADEKDARSQSMLNQSLDMSKNTETARQAHMSPGNSQPQREAMAPDEDYASIADAIIAKKRKAKMMAAGGMVDLEANSEEDPNNEDQMSFEANGKEQYDLDQLSSQPEDSNETGDEREDDAENQHDMVSSIRKKMKKRYG